jgi:xylulokinase
MLKRQVDLIEGMGVGVDEIRSIGGGARSPLWLQIKADVLGKSIRTTESEETACLGAAMIGAVGAGYYADLDAAAANMVRLKATITPNPAQRAVYAQAYARYCELYDRLAPMFV